MVPVSGALAAIVKTVEPGLAGRILSGHVAALFD
jgi:hypothetical protein